MARRTSSCARLRSGQRRAAASSASLSNEISRVLLRGSTAAAAGGSALTSAATSANPPSAGSKPCSPDTDRDGCPSVPDPPAAPSPAPGGGGLQVSRPTVEFRECRITHGHSNSELQRMPTLQLVLLLFGHTPHQRFITSGPKTLGTEQHHVTTNSALNSDKVLDDNLGVVKLTDFGRKTAHQCQEWKTMHREVFGFTDRAIH
jgi:hypothetical protein